MNLCSHYTPAGGGCQGEHLPRAGGRIALERGAPEASEKRRPENLRTAAFPVQSTGVKRFHFTCPYDFVPQPLHVAQSPVQPPCARLDFRTDRTARITTTASAASTSPSPQPVSIFTFLLYFAAAATERSRCGCSTPESPLRTSRKRNAASTASATTVHRPKATVPVNRPPI